MFKLTLILVGSLFSANSYAGAFQTCPSKAFLIQQSVAKMYGVNLVSGNTSLLVDDLGTDNKVNALGFSLHDRYLYGWGYEAGTLVRIGDDYQVQPLAIQNSPNSNFYVGDVSAQENTYYMYNRGAGLGLYAVDLDETSANYFEAVKIIGSDSLNLNIFDLAFHPFDGFAYSVDSSGLLIQIDVTNGSSQQLGNVGERGTFGAVYFDVEGNFYISRNADGIVFRIELDKGLYNAEQFANGPASNNNDGARCAIAPIIDDDATNIDFGDAPESYGSSLTANGARHELVEQGLFLGNRIDGESNSAFFPASDNAVGIADEDGVQFITSVETGLQAVIEVVASKEGYLNAWLDSNLSGTFDDDERVIDSRFVQSGTNKIVFSVPANAQAGGSWMRFRLSNESSLGPLGGTVDGEVEDYPVSIVGSGVSSEFYPSSSGWSTVAFEDKWPVMGDYDSNDVVVHLRTTLLSESSTLKQIVVDGMLVGMGGSFHNGFAVNLPGLQRHQIEAAGVVLSINGEVQTSVVLEADRSEAILILTDDLWDLVPAQSNCNYFRTESGCEQVAKVSFRFTVPVADATERPLELAGVFDPFIFATPDTYHGDLVGSAGRSWEVHQKNLAPTSAFDSNLFGLGDDASNPAASHYYQTDTGMPWAFQMANEWMHPLETVDLLRAYPEFEAFAMSDGKENTTWYLRQKADLSQIINQ